MSNFETGATSVGKGIGGFLGGLVTPIIGSNTTTTETSSSTPNQKNTTTVIVIVLVIVVAVIGYFSLRGKKQTTT